MGQREAVYIHVIWLCTKKPGDFKRYLKRGLGAEFPAPVHGVPSTERDLYSTSVYRVGMTGNSIPRLPENDKMADMSKPFRIVSQACYKFTCCFHLLYFLVK
jgi:hypothetical protein